MLDGYYQKGELVLVTDRFGNNEQIGMLIDYEYDDETLDFHILIGDRLIWVSPAYIRKLQPQLEQ
jgi:hypothetical protein